MSSEVKYKVTVPSMDYYLIRCLRHSVPVSLWLCNVLCIGSIDLVTSPVISLFYLRLRIKHPEYLLKERFGIWGLLPLQIWLTYHPVDDWDIFSVALELQCWMAAPEPHGSCCISLLHSQTFIAQASCHIHSAGGKCRALKSFSFYFMKPDSIVFSS